MKYTIDGIITDTHNGRCPLCQQAGDQAGENKGIKRTPAKREFSSERAGMNKTGAQYANQNAHQHDYRQFGQ